LTRPCDICYKTSIPVLHPGIPTIS
jgi:hypothetical protein